MECHFVQALAFASCWGIKLEGIVAKVRYVGDIEALTLFILEPPPKKDLFTLMLTCLLYTT